MPTVGYIYNSYTDLYDISYAPKPTILYLSVTSNNITAKLLGASDQGGYSPIPNATIHIYELQGTTWNKIGDYVTDQNGLISIDRTNTLEWYKAVFDGNDEYQQSVAYAELQQATPSQPPPEQQAQQSIYTCPSMLWVILLLIPLLFKKREEEIEE